MISIFNHLSQKDKRLAIEDLIHDSTPRPSFFAMVILSVLMATFGLLIDNASVIIGSMLIAPILSPILSLSMGIVMSDSMLVARSGWTLIKSLAVGVALATVATLFVSAESRTVGAEILSRMQPSLVFFSIAFVSGFAAALARVNPDLSETLPGIAISVALIPPLAVVGIGIALLNWPMISGAAMLMAVNVVGIVFASMLVFSMMNLYVNRDVAVRAAQAEDRALEREKARAEREKAKAESATAKGA